MADAGSNSPDEDFARSRFTDLNVFDREQTWNGVEHGSFHWTTVPRSHVDLSTRIVRRRATRIG
jgi:hypothetical protein